MASVSNNDWDNMITDFITEYGFTEKSTQKEVFKQVYSFLQEKYKGKKVPKGRIKFVADDITESICLRLSILC